MNLSAHLSRHHSGRPSRGWPGRLLALCAILLLGACTLPPARAQSDEWQLGRIDDSSGTVWLDRDGDGSRHGVWRQQRLLDGDVVSTGGGGRAEISISRHRLRLDEHTRLRLLRFDDGRIEIELRHGSIGLGVYPASQAGSILISTAAGVIQPLDDGLLRVDADVDQRWAVTTWRQDVLIRQGRDQMQLGRHRRAELYRDGGWRLGPPQPDSFSAWIRPLEEDRPPIVIQEPPAYMPAPIVRPAPIYNPPPVIIVPARPPQHDHDWRRQPPPPPPAPARPPEGWMRPPMVIAPQPPVVIPPSRPPVLEVHPGLRQPERPVEPPRQDRIISTMPTQPPAVVPTTPVTPPPIFRQPAQPTPQPVPQPAHPPAFRPAPAASSPSGEMRQPLPMRRQREEVR